MTAAQVAGLLQVNVETVRRWLRSGELEGVLLGDKAGYRVTEGAIKKFLDRRRLDRLMGADRDTTTDARDER